jgi:hypothetical protein
VWLRLSHWPAPSVRPTGAAKLSAKYFGPYQILDKVGLASYCLQLSAHAKIHNVFHVVFLKKFEGMPPVATPPLPPIVHGLAVATSWELLVQWHGWKATEASWEEIVQFKLQILSSRTSSFTKVEAVSWTHSSIDSTCAGARPLKGKSSLVTNYLVIDLLGYSIITPQG